MTRLPRPFKARLSTRKSLSHRDIRPKDITAPLHRMFAVCWQRVVHEAYALLRRGQCKCNTRRLSPGGRDLPTISAPVPWAERDGHPGNILDYRDELDEDGLSTMQRAGLVSCESGATAVEFALVLPPFLMLFLGILSACLAVFAAASLHYAAEGAARCFSINACSTQRRPRAMPKASIMARIAQLPGLNCWLLPSSQRHPQLPDYA